VLLTVLLMYFVYTDNDWTAVFLSELLMMVNFFVSGELEDNASSKLDSDE